jgi:hypothetical protein
MLTPDAFKVAREELETLKDLGPATRAAVAAKMAKIERAHRKAESDIHTLCDWLRYGDKSGGFDWDIIRALHGRD